MRGSRPNPLSASVSLGELQTSLSVIASADDHGWLFSPHECIALPHLLWKSETEVSTTSDYAKSNRFAKVQSSCRNEGPAGSFGTLLLKFPVDYTEGVSVRSFFSMRALKVTVARLGILVALLLPSPQVIPEVDSGGYPRVVLNQ